MQDDQEARTARAKSLREQIAQVVGQQKPDNTAEPPSGAASAAGPAPTEAASDVSGAAQKAPAVPESPRDFVHRRMRELEEERRSRQKS